MNKHTAIVIIASFIIAGPFVFAVSNIYGAVKEGIRSETIRSWVILSRPIHFRHIYTPK